MTQLFATDDAVEVNRKVTDGKAVLIDSGKLESALSRTTATYDGVPLYPNRGTQAAGLLEGLVAAHAFSDGNKRTAWVLTRVFLKAIGARFVSPSPEEIADFVEGVTVHRFSHDDMVKWFENNSK